MPTSVALSPHLEAFVREQVVAGRYNNVSEVVRDGLLAYEGFQVGTKGNTGGHNVIAT